MMIRGHLTVDTTYQALIVTTSSKKNIGYGTYSVISKCSMMSASSVSATSEMYIKLAFIYVTNLKE
jgi:hypothetical protein